MARNIPSKLYFGSIKKNQPNKPAIKNDEFYRVSYNHWGFEDDLYQGTYHYGSWTVCDVVNCFLLKILIFLPPIWCNVLAVKPGKSNRADEGSLVCYCALK